MSRILKWVIAAIGLVVSVFAVGRLTGRRRGAAAQRSKDAGEVKNAQQRASRAEAEADKERIRAEGENRARAARSAGLDDVYSRAEEFKRRQRDDGS